MFEPLKFDCTILTPHNHTNSPEQIVVTLIKLLLKVTVCQPFQTDCKVIKIEQRQDKAKKIACAPSEDSDQPGHPLSLIRVFAVRMKKARVYRYH